MLERPVEKLSQKCAPQVVDDNEGFGLKFVRTRNAIVPQGLEEEKAPIQLPSIGVIEP